METAKRDVRYLTGEEIIALNHSFVICFGRDAQNAGKVFNRDALEYLVWIVQQDLEGSVVYPRLYDKAAAYAFHIITRHIFVAGNKRTGIGCAFYYLGLHGCSYVGIISEDELVKLGLDIADKLIDIPALASWLEERFAC